MTLQVLVASEGEAIAGAIGGGIAFAALCVSIAAYYCVAEWRRAQEARIEADLKRDLAAKDMSAEDIERVLKATTPPRIL